MSHKSEDSSKKIADALKENESTASDLPEDMSEEMLTQEKLIEHPGYQSLEQKLNETEAELNEAKNQLLRVKADQANADKRAQQEIVKTRKYALDKFALDLLPVVDSIERGLSIEVGGNEFAMRVHEGMEMTLNLLLKTLEKFDVKQINPINQVFNPEFHQAISTQGDSTVKPNTVIQVLQKGYLLNDRLIRPALVVVSKED